jgi:hypothetical protein
MNGMALTVDLLPGNQLSIVRAAERASIILLADDMTDAQELAANGWGTIKASENFGALFRLSAEAQQALRNDMICPHCGGLT